MDHRQQHSAPTTGDSRAQVSPDGDRLAYIRNRNDCRDDNRDLRVLDLESGDERRITETPALTRVGRPTWSPDGRRLAFTVITSACCVYGVGGHEQSDLFVAHADGSDIAQLTDTPHQNESMPTWSPDGGQIAFERRGLDTSVIVTMHADGTGERQLTPNDLDAHSPRWSPTGRDIALMGLQGVMVVRADGRDLRTLDPTAPDGSPWNEDAWSSPWMDWSPDGQHLAYNVEDSDRPTFGVRVVDVGIGEPRSITTGYAGAWSPSGDHLAVIRTRMQSGWSIGALHIVSRDGTDQQELNTWSDEIAGWTR